MYFDEGRRLNFVDRNESNSPSPIGSGRQSTQDPSSSWRVAVQDPLDTARNKLQELMQLFYLLSRDSRVPQDARYHVTVAQSEIALLSKIMQNGAETATEVGKPSSGHITTNL